MIFVPVSEATSRLPQPRVLPAVHHCFSNKSTLTSLNFLSHLPAKLVCSWTLWSSNLIIPSSMAPSSCPLSLSNDLLAASSHIHPFSHSSLHLSYLPTPAPSHPARIIPVLFSRLLCSCPLPQVLCSWCHLRTTVSTEYSVQELWRSFQACVSKRTDVITKYEVKVWKYHWKKVLLDWRNWLGPAKYFILMQIELSKK